MLAEVRDVRQRRRSEREDESDSGLGAHGSRIELSILGMQDNCAMTLLWFVVWLISNVIGDHEPLLFDPVNWWTGTLLAAIALDLGRQHASKHL